MKLIQERAWRSNLGSIIGPWKNFGKLLKGELKRTIVNLNTFLQLTLGPSLARADYEKVMLKNKRKISEIDKQAEQILDQMPGSSVVSGVGWVLAPGPMLFNTVRETSKKVTPDAVDSFMDEYGFKDLYLGRIPVGKMFTSLAKKGAQAGGFATMNRQAMEKSMKDMEKGAEDKWYTPIERILQLQIPWKAGPGASLESSRMSGNLLLEAEQGSEEEKAFLDYLKMQGFEDKYMKEVGIPYVDAKDELITGIIDIFEKEIEETSLIATAATFEDFVKAIQSSTVEKFKPLKGQNFKDQMLKEVETLIGDKETLDKFLKVINKDISDFENKEDDLKKLLAQKLYEKEFTEVRIQSITSIEDAIEEIKVEILGDLEEDKLDSIRINPLGEKLYNTIKSGLQRLDKAAAAITAVSSEAQKIAG